MATNGNETMTKEKKRKKMSNNTKLETSLSRVSSLEEAVEIYLEASEGEKVIGIMSGARWDYEESVYYAWATIGDGWTHATVRLERKVDDYKSAPSRGVEFEWECHSIGDELAEELTALLGSEWSYGIEIA